LYVVVAFEKEVAARESTRRRAEKDGRIDRLCCCWMDIKRIFRIAKQNMPERSCGKRESSQDK
jgi:16S rRNA A1518/A1519 N6-dimethyltransferase RsmA/KsgA/DIM1 with predicted DNA glycosylase/AP lyase activity